MKYYAVQFNIRCDSAVRQDACDVLSAMVGEAGFESFEETEEGLTGYIQQQLFNQESIDAVVEDFPFGSSAVTYTVSEAEDRDWNEAWEQEGFDPIWVKATTAKASDGFPARIIVIHDGRHTEGIPADAAGTMGADAATGVIPIEIDAHQAFGTGTHETTRMVCSSLLSLDLSGCRVLDCGCGTGILGIVALKLGAKAVVAYDIDEWSVDNTRHNSIINRVEERMEVMDGDATLLNNDMGGMFDVVVANINRNILLTDMPAMCRQLKDGGTLILSGFYTADVAMLTGRAAELSLSVVSVSEDQDWAMMMLRRASK